MLYRAFGSDGEVAASFIFASEDKARKAAKTSELALREIFAVMR
jgi:hypothetical protein